MSANIAVSGIQAINDQLNVISGNIANANTVGYKTRRANFAAMISGTRIGSYSQSMDTLGAQNVTGGLLDAMINGKGFFVVRDNLGQLLYTRNGGFSRGPDDRIVDSFGRPVQGLQSGALGDLKVPTGSLPPEATANIEFSANLKHDWPVPATKPFDPDKEDSYNQVATSTIYDSLGGQHVVTQYFIKQEDGTVQVHYRLDKNAPIATPTTLTFEGGKLAEPTDPVQLKLGAPAGAQPLSIKLSYAGMTSYASDYNATRNQPDGYPPGDFARVKLAENGDIIAVYNNKQERAVGTLALAHFANAAGLDPQNDSAYAATRNSGNALYTTAGGVAGDLITGSLEGSNAELTLQMVDLMTAQRNYQANAKVLSADAQMSQALMQAL
ncbi:flagellar hook protein FlgE [Chitinasiproducens palmae]|uniref:Flagellar hook protein FlgE n=1 Tax=Chitinasiproducens palmae TaxID=1770053 RepID=A0A1H2PLJ6_9BURK|nr:flagellar hook-basal body complex protein [Chitinasiproducens palmae]SDV46951.1 flagellar hook protein FlgE [Chitinasiproducens palmae]